MKIRGGVTMSSFLYDRNAPFIKYDFSLSKNLYFQQEVQHQTAYISKKKRYILSSSMLNSFPCQMDTIKEKMGDLILISYQQQKVLLTSCGKHIDYLVFMDATIPIALSLLREHMLANHTYVDITKYPFLYAKPLYYFLYKKINVSKHFYCDNKMAWDYLNSNFFHHLILKKDCVGQYKETYFLNQNCTLSYPHIFQTKENEKSIIFVKEEISQNDQEYEEIELPLFLNEIQKVNEFQYYDAYEELKDLVTYGGFCIVLKENEKIISGACIEKIGQNYLHISYLFTHVEFQRKGYGSKLLKAIENIASTHHKGILLLCASKTAALFYQKNGFKQDQTFIDTDIKE